MINDFLFFLRERLDKGGFFVKSMDDDDDDYDRELDSRSVIGNVVELIKSG